jgi:hypothetical protein
MFTHLVENLLRMLKATREIAKHVAIMMKAEKMRGQSLTPAWMAQIALTIIQIPYSQNPDFNNDSKDDKDKSECQKEWAHHKDSITYGIGVDIIRYDTRRGLCRRRILSNRQVHDDGRAAKSERVKRTE